MWENIVGRSRPFWNHFYPQLQAAFPDTLGDVEQESFYRAINRVKPVLHPRRRGRGDLQPAHHPALRARAGDDRGHDRAEGAAGGLERALRGVPRDPGPERQPWASSRTCTGRAAASATSRPTRSATSSRCRSGTRRWRSSPTCRRSSRPGEFGELHAWLRTQPLRARPQVHPAGDARARRRRRRSTRSRTSAT